MLEYITAFTHFDRQRAEVEGSPPFPSASITASLPFAPFIVHHAQEMVDIAHKFHQHLDEENAAAAAVRSSKAARKKAGMFHSSFSFSSFHSVSSSIAAPVVGKLDPRKRLDSFVRSTIEENLSQSLAMMLASVAF
jgi:hypothetical protein